MFINANARTLQPMKEKLKEYIEADALEKLSTNAKKSLREYIGKLLRRCHKQGIEVPGLNYSAQEKYKFNEDLLYEWVGTQVSPEVLETLTKKTIDIEKLHDLYLAGGIDTTLISPDVYSITKYFTITVNHKKVNK